jgi:type III restriction enzyme
MANPQGAPEYAVINVSDWGDMFAGQSRTELGVGDGLLLAEEKLAANTRLVQARNDIDLDNPSAPLEAWELFDAAANTARGCPHFSVEMETGTGKTYVYLRTIFELSRRYGFQKFIIVVPSVAIREGVLKTSTLRQSISGPCSTISRSSISFTTPEGSIGCASSQ